jgi:hypothetical protein
MLYARTVQGKARAPAPLTPKIEYSPRLHRKSAVWKQLPVEGTPLMTDQHCEQVSYDDREVMEN